MLYCSTEYQRDPEKYNDVKPYGHLQQIKDQVIGLRSFDDLFKVINALLNKGVCHIENTSRGKNLVIHVNSPISIDNLVIKAGDYFIAIGNNGFMVTAYPQKGRKIK